MTSGDDGGVNQEAFLDFLKQHYQKDGDSGLSEEVLWRSPRPVK